MVLEAGDEDPDLGVDSVGLCQQADAEVQVPEGYAGEVGRDRKRLLGEHLQEKVGALDEMDDAILALMLRDVQRLKRWRVAAAEVAVAAAQSLLRAGVVLANFGGLLWGEQDGDEEEDQEAAVAVVDDGQQLENGCETPEPLLRHVLALRHVLQHAADENLAAAQDAVQEQEEVVVAVVAAAAEQQQLLESGDEYWDLERAKNAHW